MSEVADVQTDFVEVKKPVNGGWRAGSGRKPGSLNKYSSTVKLAVLEAFDLLGGTQFLYDQAKLNPNAFLTLLGKILPMQAEITGKDGEALTVAPIIFIGGRLELDLIDDAELLEHAELPAE